MTRDIQQRNHLLAWSLFIGVITVVLSLSLVFYINFDLLRDPSRLTDRHLRIFLGILSVVFTGVVVHFFTQGLANRLNRNYFKRFQELRNIGAFSESLSQAYMPQKKYEHVVLLLHGFTASPQEFGYLMKIMQLENIPYIAPMMPGFGLNSTEELKSARFEDWFRTALTYYDYLSTIADKVSVIGHSMGAILATFVGQHRPVYKMILSAPGIFPTKADLIYRRILTAPVLSNLFIAVVSYLPKPIRKGRTTTADMLNEESTTKIFQYMAVPVNSVKQIFLAQAAVDARQLRAESLLILYGKHDITVNVAQLIGDLEKSNLPFTAHCLENTAHNIFEDYQRLEGCQLAVNFLKGEVVIKPKA
jgi:esterase/lipase